MPGSHDSEDSTSNEAFPGLVGRKGYERALNELATACHSGNVGHDIVTKDKATGKDIPEETVEYVVHEIFQLANG